jgi:putative glutathione S-transferase
MAAEPKRWKPTINDKGEFVRKDSQFRNFISKDGEFTPEADRYHLYISLACPWAHRTLIVRNLKGLQDIIGLSVVDYFMGPEGWEFTDRPGAIPDTLYNSKFIKEIYFRADPEYTGRFTVPVLWDKKNQTIVNNESSEIIRMFNSEFNGKGLAKNPTVDFYPEKLRKEIDVLNDEIYHNLNNGVYKTGFATSQEAHATNSKLVHATMLKVEDILKNKEFLVGNVLTEADIRLFTTIVRYDPVYYGHFKCNLISVRELPNLSRWMKQIYEMEGVKETVNMVHIKHHYYESHKQINPYGVVPLYNGPLFPSD